MEKTVWDSFVDYINNMPIGSIVSRPELCYATNRSPKKENTVDQYKRFLVITNILKPIARGKYQIIYHVNKKLTPTAVRNIAYSIDSSDCLMWFNEISKNNLLGA